jgi:hypothetical protein
MEYRAYLKIPGLAFGDEARWEPLIERLENRFQDLGPVIGFYDDGAEIIVSMPAQSEADAAKRGFAAVTECLREVGIGDLYPGSVEVEPVPDDELATA